MLNAFQARKTSTESQLALVLDYIDNAIQTGYKDINITEELEDDNLYSEVISVLTKHGFDVIVKKYSNRIENWISWEEGKIKNGNLVYLDYTLSEEINYDDSEEESNGTILFFN